MRLTGAPLVFERYILCGDMDRIPDVFRVTSAGCERRHAIQTTMYRQPGESDSALLLRTLIIALKLNLRLDEYDPFSPMLGGTIVFDYEATPADEEFCTDDWVNAKRRLMHRATHDQSSRVRFDAAWRLGQLLGVELCESGPPQ
jgi:hypothetical protein